MAGSQHFGGMMYGIFPKETGCDGSPPCALYKDPCAAKKRYFAQIEAGEVEILPVLISGHCFPNDEDATSAVFGGVTNWQEGCDEQKTG